MCVTIFAWEAHLNVDVLLLTFCHTLCYFYVIFLISNLKLIFKHVFMAKHFYVVDMFLVFSLKRNV